MPSRRPAGAVAAFGWNQDTSMIAQSRLDDNAGAVGLACDLALLPTREYWSWAKKHGRPPRQDDKDFAARFYLSPRQLKRWLRQLRDAGTLTWPPHRE